MNVPGRRDPQAMIPLASQSCRCIDCLCIADAKFVPGEEAEGSFVAV